MHGFDMPTRLVGVRERLLAADVQALFVTNLTNVRWLCGFTGSNGWLVVTPSDCVLVTDGRYGDQAGEEIRAVDADARVLVGTSRSAMVEHARAALGGAATIGFEASNITVEEHRALSSALQGPWSSLPGAVEEGRRCKDQGEIDRMKHAAFIADAALAHCLPLLRNEPTEAEFRDELEFTMRNIGADGPSFDTIVGAGANAALPHHHPDQTRIVEGMTVVIDFGALYQGYHSDMTRTFAVGDPTAVQQEVYDVVLAAQQAGLAGVMAGARGKEIDKICRRSITDAGWGEWFTHGTGHGVGLDIHESPWLTQNFDDTLRVSDVVTVEPGVYRRGSTLERTGNSPSSRALEDPAHPLGFVGGVRIEDMVVVTTSGCQSFTTTPKDSLCLPSPPTI